LSILGPCIIRLRYEPASYGGTSVMGRGDHGDDIFFETGGAQTELNIS